MLTLIVPRGVLPDRGAAPAFIDGDTLDIDSEWSACSSQIALSKVMVAELFIAKYSARSQGAAADAAQQSWQSSSVSKVVFDAVSNARLDLKCCPNTCCCAGEMPPLSFRGRA